MKKVVLAGVVVFLVFWLITDPRGLAATSESAASTVWGGARQLFTALIDFATEVG
jgi:hypothetical protein